MSHSVNEMLTYVLGQQCATFISFADQLTISETCLGIKPTAIKWRSFDGFPQASNQMRLSFTKKSHLKVYFFTTTRRHVVDLEWRWTKFISRY